MERDFMGLNNKDSVISVKEEVVEISKDTGFPNASTVPWSSSSKMSALPHFMSFKPVQDEKPSPGFMAMSSGERQSAEFQMLPYTVGNPSFKAHVAGAGQSFAGATMKPQFLGGIPVATPHSFLPSGGFFSGTTDPRVNSKASGAQAQLTIFYAGTVNVYNDISPEKAQAIMFLAGNGCIPNNASQKIQVPARASEFCAGDGSFMNKNMNTTHSPALQRTMNTTPCPALSSPLSVSSHPIGKTCALSIENDEASLSKAVSISSTLVSIVETPKISASLGPVSSGTIMPSAVPQARKASLARFLEKRKERVTSTSPYHITKKSSENTDVVSNFVDHPASSGTGYTSKSSGKETSYNV